MLKDFNAKKVLEDGFKAAEELLKDTDKVEKFLYRLEIKLKEIPAIGDKLSMVSTMAAMILSYVKKEYTDVPLGTIIVALSALIYLVNPVDLIPDTIPVIGLAEDVLVVNTAFKLIDSDLEEYKKWRDRKDQTR